MARVPRVYTPQALGDNQTICLEPSASHHLLKVLRMTVGRALIVFNGDGYEFLACISSTDKKAATVTTQTGLYSPRVQDVKITLAIGLSKGDRFDYVLQKATELGVSEVVPLFTERSEVRLKQDRIEKKMQSWHSIITGACEQSQRNVLPKLRSPDGYNNFIESFEAEEKFVLHHRTEATLSNESPPKSVCVLIGPEGGLSDEEIRNAIKCDFKALSLGPRVLRTETAPLAALSILQYVWGDF